MSSKGCCYDNAACESFFGTLKVELVHDESYKTREEAKLSIFEGLTDVLATHATVVTANKDTNINFFSFFSLNLILIKDHF
ncbi:hypothetical protein CDV26_01585 [Francisella halioticida]|uniref:Integrase catalytic domain-containing protein n=1 Tax=Francisella halioticida TaxID=549298 RepID=A0ABM6LX87_9GAMM|nr:hypothetical protein CDV26_01585 [Francisella halioticida]